MNLEFSIESSETSSSIFKDYVYQYYKYMFHWQKLYMSEWNRH